MVDSEMPRYEGKYLHYEPRQNIDETTYMEMYRNFYYNSICVTKQKRQRYMRFPYQSAYFRITFAYSLHLRATDDCYMTIAFSRLVFVFRICIDK